MLKPSKSAVARARAALTYRQHRLGREYFRPRLATSNRVEFFFGGYEVVFVYENGRILRIPHTQAQIYLTPEDYALLASEAEVWMKACFEGYKKAKKGAPVGKNKEGIQLELPFTL